MIWSEKEKNQETYNIRNYLKKERKETYDWQ
jgi:hypothetical protein